MFGNTAEKRIAREADRVASLKDDLDALSWGRVLEIGKHLQSKGLDPSGSELVAIAQSNISLATHLGIDPAPPEERMMASGMEVLEGGFAEAALESPKAASSEAKIGAFGTLAEMNAVGRSAAKEPQAKEPQGKVLPIKKPPQDVVAELRAREDETADETFDPQEPSEGLVFRSTIELPAVLPVPPGTEKPKAKAKVEAKRPSVLDSEPTVAAEPEQDGDRKPCAQAKKRPKLRRFSRFRNLYESRDGSLCVFEDEYGHLVAVDASRLA